MNIRTYRPGDETAQAEIYNSAAASLAKFKPVNVVEIQRRTRARDFDPATRFYAETDGRVVGYCGFHANGRVCYPWCLPGHEEACRQPLFDAVLAAMTARPMTRAFAAYRKNWPTINGFFAQRGFAPARDMMNYRVDFVEMPTPGGRVSSGITPVTPDDVPAIFALAPEVFRVRTAEELHRHLFRNPWFGSNALFALRSQADHRPLAVGLVIDEPTYADPATVDADMPCFRLGAFGTEGMQVKRLRGLFSFVARQENSLFSYGMQLLAHAAARLKLEEDVTGFVAQVASDVPLLHAFYQRVFRPIGSFPVLERDLTTPFAPPAPA